MATLNDAGRPITYVLCIRLYFSKGEVCFGSCFTRNMVDGSSIGERHSFGYTTFLRILNMGLLQDKYITLLGKVSVFLHHPFTFVKWSAKKLQEIVINILMGFHGPPNWKVCVLTNVL